MEKLPPKHLRKLGLLWGGFLLNRSKLITEPLRLPLQVGGLPLAPLSRFSQMVPSYSTWFLTIA